MSYAYALTITFIFNSDCSFCAWLLPLVLDGPLPTAPPGSSFLPELPWFALVPALSWPLCVSYHCSFDVLFRGRSVPGGLGSLSLVL